MVEPITIEGTWEEIAARAAEFAGRRVRLVVLPGRVDEETSTNGDQGTTKRHKSIEEVAEEMFADVPEEEWKKLPPDLSAQLDHYIYGTPKT